MPFGPLSRAVSLFVLTWIVAGLCLSHSVCAAEGEPLAVRIWADGHATIETHWNLTLQVFPDGDTKGTADDFEWSKNVSGADQSVPIKNDLNHVLSRSANESEIQWAPQTTRLKPDEMHVRSLSEYELRIDVDGVTIGVWSSGDSASGDSTPGDSASGVNPSKASSTITNSVESGTTDVLVCLAAKRSDVSDLVNAFNRLRSSTVLFDAATDPEVISRFTEQTGLPSPLSVAHNTFAVSMNRGEKPAAAKVVLLDAKPWQADAELKSLIEQMEQSCMDSQKVFSKLTAAQMSFKPSNGTHTPRWNTEHMMGRQLLFFSQIYHQIDPTIPVMDLNPKQMPPDYTPAHATWDGEEESRQMQRVSDFTRRFAYLLEGIDLDKPAPGSRWTPRSLLKQMQRHYTVHTANTIKKFELPDWPAH